VNDLVDAVSLIAEVITWVGLSLGSAILIVGLIWLGLSGRWVRTDGVVVDDTVSAQSFRWIDSSGEVREDFVDDTGVVQRKAGDAVTVYFDSWRPWKGRIDSPAQGGRAFRLAGGILLAIGALSLVLSFVLMFVPAVKGATP